MIPPIHRQQFMLAITAWARWCLQQRLPYRHPYVERSTLGRKYLHLRDGMGTLLARYELYTGRIAR